MSDERARILKLLEDGKVTAEQAARLIEALGPKRPEFEWGPMARHAHRRGGLRELDRIPEIVAQAVSSAVRSGVEPGSDEGRLVFAGKRDLFVKSVSGDVDVTGWAEEKVSLNYSGGMVKSRSEDGSVQVRSVSGDVEAQIPHAGRLQVETVSGDVTAEGLAGRAYAKTVSGDITIEGARESVQAQSVSGDVELAHIAGELEVETRSGDIDIEAVGPFSGAAGSRSGDVTLRVGPDADVLLEMECEADGDIDLDVDFPHEVEEQRQGYARVRIGAGSRTMKLRTANADITVCAREESQ
jgi:DUF4097 and DUF4098 domain-containing protein YvlB